MPKTSAQARPANLRRTLRRLLSYMGHAKFSLLAVGMLASVAAIASLAGTYMVRPIVNGLATGGEELLAKQVLFTAVIYAAGVLSALAIRKSWCVRLSGWCPTFAATCSRISRRCRSVISTARARATS